LIFYPDAASVKAAQLESEHTIVEARDMSNQSPVLFHYGLEIDYEQEALLYATKNRAPHELQNCDPGREYLPQFAQRIGCCICTSGAGDSVVRLHTSAATQPTRVQPRKRLSTKIAFALRFLRPMMLGKKYGMRSRTIRAIVAEFVSGERWEHDSTKIASTIARAKHRPRSLAVCHACAVIRVIFLPIAPWLPLERLRGVVLESWWSDGVSRRSCLPCGP